MNEGLLVYQVQRVFGLPENLEYMLNMIVRNGGCIHTIMPSTGYLEIRGSQHAQPSWDVVWTKNAEGE